MPRFTRTLALLGLTLATTGLTRALDGICPPDGYVYEPSPTTGGVVNTYYPPLDDALPPGSTVINLGPPVGAAATVVEGDLFLVIQMQGARIDSSDDDRYGDGLGDGVADAVDQGQGFLDDAGLIAGRYEYVMATGPIVAGALPIAGAGPGTLFAYSNAGATATEGRRRYQVVRVPRYAFLSIPNGGLVAAEWDGTTGGILAVEVVGALNLNDESLSAADVGFRGGHGQRLTGDALAGDADYRRASAPGFSMAGAHGNKGEGIAGTPRYSRRSSGNAAESVEVDAEGYPQGSRGRGAPGNAGGGGTDGNPTSNNDAAGGGGGGNGGPGGRGGHCSSGKENGGHGGAAFRDPSTSAPLWNAGVVVMGGGGGSGSKNDNNPDKSSGAGGGGIVLVRTGSVVGSGLIDVRGQDAPQTGNDGAGGGGAGGSVVFVSDNPDFTGVTLTINANGGRGADAGTGGSTRGPGGGGGGGVVLMNAYTNGSGVVVTTDPGANGLTEHGTVPHGAAAGTVGTPPPGDPGNPFIDPTDIPGVDFGGDCGLNQPPVATNNSYSTPSGTALVVGPPGLLADDTDPDNDSLMVDPVPGTAPDPTTQGTLTLDDDGSFTFVPVAGFSGTATFSYRISDGKTSSPYATVTITVGAAGVLRRIRDALGAGYCGLLGLEAIAILGLLRLVRGRRRRG